jgi:hypothetical protein
VDSGQQRDGDNEVCGGEQTQELPAVHCEPSWDEIAAQRIRISTKEYAEWHLQHFGYPLLEQKHILPEEISLEKTRMLEEMQTEIDQLNWVLDSWGIGRDGKAR